MTKPRISAKSVPWLVEIDRHVRECNIRGAFDRFRDIAADPLDGYARRADLDDLIRRRFLAVVRYGFDDSMGRDPLREMSPKQCGTSWSVNPTEKMIRTFWPHRLEDAAS